MEMPAGTRAQADGPVPNVGGDEKVRDLQDQLVPKPRQGGSTGWRDDVRDPHRSV